MSVFAGTTGKIAGKAIDAENGLALPAVNITIVGTSFGTAANSNGEYFILNLLPGIYEVQADRIGYASVIKKKIRVFADLTTQVNFSLPVKALEFDKVIEVIAQRPLLQRDITSTVQIITDEQIQNLPIIRTNDVLALNSASQGSGNNLHTRGGRRGETAILLDGLYTEDPQTRTIGFNISPEALREIQIISGGFNAEYGNAQSGVILLNTKEGDPNKYSGGFVYQTDHIGNGGIGESSETLDLYKFNFSGPASFLSKTFNSIGIQAFNDVRFFLQGETRLTDRIDLHNGALKDAGDSPVIKTADPLRNETIFDKLLGLGGARESVRNNWDTKLTWQQAPARKLSIGWRGRHDNLHNWTFLNSLNVRNAVAQAQAMGISDGIDSDGDGSFDEELLNGIDDDGDGFIDEDSRLVEAGSGQYNGDFAWGIDNDGDGKIDEEAFNGIDDDDDGLIDEDLQPYNWQGYDHMWRRERRAQQLVLNWTHAIGDRTFYEIKLARFETFTGTLPKLGKDGSSRSSFDELEKWISQYDAAQAEIARIRAAGGEVPGIEELIEPYRGFGDPSEPFIDQNDNHVYDLDEPFTDWDGDGLWDRNGGNNDNAPWTFAGATNPFRGQRFNGAYTSDFGGGRVGFSKRQSIVYTLKFDVTSQVNTTHQLKSGLEASYFDLEKVSRDLLGPYNGGGSFGNSYHVFPNWQAFYLQDKMEFTDAVINLGVRVERFDQGDQVAQPETTNPRIPTFDEPEIKLSFMPRIGFSFPVTLRDVFYFNYSRFQQRPRLDRLYDNVNRAISSANTIVGNPNLDPEETIAYEFGVRHQFGLNTLFTVTGFFKNIDHLLQLTRMQDTNNNIWWTYDNETFGTVRGLQLKLTQRAGRYFSGNIGYTFQIAKTIHSSSRRTFLREDFFNEFPGTEFHADWDQRHRVIMNLNYQYSKGQGPSLGNFYPLENWNINLLVDIVSGQPYTPESSSGIEDLVATNTRRFPWIYEVSLRMQRSFPIAEFQLAAIFQIQNLLNRRNAVSTDNRDVDLVLNDTIDPFRNRIGFDNAASPERVRNFGGFTNAVANPAAWQNGRVIRLGISAEF